MNPLAVNEPCRETIKAKEVELSEKNEELQAQREELNAAIEELVSKNKFLIKTLDELTKRQQEIEELVYRLSHDVKGPLASIKGLCNLMKLEKIPSTFHPHIGQIIEKGETLENLLKTLSSFSQVVVEEPEYKKINLQELYFEILKSLESENHFSEASFLYLNKGDQHCYSDKSKVFLLLRIILKNSIDFRDSVKQLLIKTTFISSENELMIFCQDNGLGIKEDIRDKIFDLFYRGSEKSKGIGLGLYTAKEIVNKLKGSINIKDSREGCKFIIKIPILKDH